MNVSVISFDLPLNMLRYLMRLNVPGILNKLIDLCVEKSKNLGSSFGARIPDFLY